MSVDRLSCYFFWENRFLKYRFGKLERIGPSINFSRKCLRIHAKETQKLFDPIKAECCNLVQQRWKTRSSTFQALSFPQIFQQKRLMKLDALAYQVLQTKSITTLIKAVKAHFFVTNLPHVFSFFPHTSICSIFLF